MTYGNTNTDYFRQNGLCEDGQPSVNGNPSSRWYIHRDIPPGGVYHVPRAKLDGTTETVQYDAMVYGTDPPVVYVPCNPGMDCHDCGARAGLNAGRRKLAENERRLPPPTDMKFIAEIADKWKKGYTVNLPPIYKTLMKMHGLPRNETRARQLHDEQVGTRSTCAAASASQAAGHGRDGGRSQQRGRVECSAAEQCVCAVVAVHARCPSWPRQLTVQAGDAPVRPSELAGDPGPASAQPMRWRSLESTLVRSPVTGRLRMLASNRPCQMAASNSTLTMS